MAGPYFVRRSDDGGSDVNDGLAWNSAKATIGAAITAAADNEIIVVASDVADSAAGNVTWTGGASDAPNIVISSTKAASGTAISYAAGASFSATDGHFYIAGDFKFYGMTLGNGATAKYIYLCNTATDRQDFYDCTLLPYYRIYFGGSTNPKILLSNTTITGTTNTATDLMFFNQAGVDFEMRGGSISWGNTSVSYGLFSGSYTDRIELCGVDLSGIEDMTQIIADAAWGGQIAFRGCKLPASWTTELTATYPTTILIERCTRASGANPDIRTQTAYGLTLYKTRTGIVMHDIGTYRTGGANDGDDDYSWKMTGGYNTCDYYKPLVTPPITAWVDGDGSSKTVTIHFAMDAYSSDSQTGSTLSTAEIWFDILSPNETASPNTGHQDRYQTSRADVAAAGTTHTAGDPWTGNAAAVYKYSFTIAPALPGPIIVRAYLATDKEDVYVCPKIDIA